MFDHFKPTPRKPQGGVSRSLTASQNHRLCVQHGYILARQPQPEPKPVEVPKPFCDEVTDVAVAAVENAEKLPAAKATIFLKEPGRAKPDIPVNLAAIITAAAKRYVARYTENSNCRYVTLPDIQDSS